ncbi:LuxR C-terminal-related transcriptional regulator [Actinophytocola sp.]
MLGTRQREVLALIAQGRTNSAIAQRLDLTLKTETPGATLCGG